MIRLRPIPPPFSFSLLRRTSLPRPVFIAFVFFQCRSQNSLQPSILCSLPPSSPTPAGPNGQVSLAHAFRLTPQELPSILPITVSSLQRRPSSSSPSSGHPHFVRSRWPPRRRSSRSTSSSPASFAATAAPPRQPFFMLHRDAHGRSPRVAQAPPPSTVAPPSLYATDLCLLPLLPSPDSPHCSATLHISATNCPPHSRAPAPPSPVASSTAGGPIPASFPFLLLSVMQNPRPRCAHCSRYHLRSTRSQPRSTPSHRRDPQKHHDHHSGHLP